ncbi:protein-methionine-sulfoxide reductase catalytic subunit MsrP [Halioxenophilus aromaticivorans]|uniref:Protein-methionine-sulfoxide reductase catalytic subunit MsrP n=1 Tax=Halioxenophilus aromaticivorans TaxID=1306992 RepID=A0AAV3U0X8_9ALTE
MLIKTKKSWQLSEAQVTDETVFRQRRTLLRQMGFLGMGGLLASHAQAGVLDWFGNDKNSGSGAKLQRELEFAKATSTQQTLTSEAKVTSYNNFYEFGLGKNDPRENAAGFRVDPWQLQLDGLVDQPQTLGYEDLFGFDLEERIYRLRCVEAWSMVIPWVGFPLADILKRAGVNSSAKYIAFETLFDPKQMPGQRSRLGGGIRYPYVEGLRMDEAMHPLTFIAVGVYGKTLAPQNGAPVRLVVPWKYGFKSIKSITRIQAVDKQPPTTWNLAAANEYGFYANVNPEVDHPRWSQATERRITRGGLGSDERIATLPFNGYGEQVAGLYQGMDLQRFY